MVNPAYKVSYFGFLFVSLLSLGSIFSKQFSNCFLQGPDCDHIRSAFFFFVVGIITFHVVFLLFRKFVSGSRYLPFMLLTVYSFFALIFTITPVLFEGGLLLKISGGTSAECALLHGYNKENCYLKLSKNSGDVKYCKNIKDSSMNSQCLSEFITSSNIDTLCNAGINKIECQINGAVKLKDPTICKEMGDKYSKYLCYSKLGSSCPADDPCH